MRGAVSLYFGSLQISLYSFHHLQEFWEVFLREEFSFPKHLVSKSLSLSPTIQTLNSPLPTLPGRKSLQHSSQSNMEGKRRCQDPEDRTDEMSFGRPGAPHLSSIRAHLKVAHPCETLYHWTVCANQDTLEPSTYHFQKQGLDKSLQTKMHGDCGLRKTLVGNSAWQNSFVKLLQTYAY